MTPLAFGFLSELQRNPETWGRFAAALISLVG